VSTVEEYGVVEVATCRGCAAGSHLMIVREDGQAAWLDCVCCGAVREIPR